MKLLDLTLPTPEENLACDEALLDAAESGAGGEVLRFWESRRHFVVVGYANAVAREVNVEACRALGIPVLRRCSGGGTVLQGPGALSYALVLRLGRTAEFFSIATTNRFIMERHREVFATLTGQTSVSVCGHTDLAAGSLKFSGNAQRRRKDFLLFHGTFLLGLDLAMIEAVLPPPSKEPTYRAGRTHREFLVNLKLDLARIKRVLSAAWNASAPCGPIPRREMDALIRQKYGSHDWNFKL